MLVNAWKMYIILIQFVDAYKVVVVVDQNINYF